MMSSLQQGTSGSGMANRVKMLSQMGIDAAQRAGVSIGQQEDKMRLLQPQMYAKIDQLERSGRNVSALFERDKYAKLMEMEQKDMFGYMENKYNWEKIQSGNSQATTDNFFRMAGAAGAGGGSGNNQNNATE